MGNTSSTNSNPVSPNPAAVSASTAALTPGAQASAIPRSASVPISGGSATPQSVPSGTTNGPSSAAATAAGAAERSIFHSGLTPPVSPPSPPPPSTPPLLPHAGHLSPQNPHALSHPQAHDFSKSTVTRLILEAKLAPFYRGLEDFEDDWTLDDIGKTLDEVREKDIEEGVTNSVSERIKEERSSPGTVGSVAKKIGIHKGREAREKEEKAAVYEREKSAYLNATECPICFLNYPPNINTSRCCQQPICTECFVQIKRSEATLTHLESEPACCPFCMETDFGVIYERPPTPVTTQRSIDSSALASSPDPIASGFSQALSMGSEEAELSVGPGMAPKAQETLRRKSVNAKDKQVVTIDEIRPDWEAKLNAVKAAAARKASRRIVMRQVGDRLIPIGYTSSRAPGTADFSMSVGNNESGSRRRRAGSGRERDLEELMIMEAMRLSMIDHEDHQKKMSQDAKTGTSGTTGNGTGASGSRAGSGSGTPQQTEFGVSTSASTSTGSAFRKRAGTEGSTSSGKDKSAASKLLSKFGGRSRSGSSASKLGKDRGDEPRVSFADQPRPGLGFSGNGGGGSGASSSTNVTSPAVSALAPNASQSSIPPIITSPTTIVDTGNGSSSGPSLVDTSVTKANTVHVSEPAISNLQQQQAPTKPVAPISPMAASPAGPVMTLTDATSASSIPVGEATHVRL